MPRHASESVGAPTRQRQAPGLYCFFTTSATTVIDETAVTPVELQRLATGYAVLEMPEGGTVSELTFTTPQEFWTWLLSQPAMLMTAQSRGPVAIIGPELNNGPAADLQVIEYLSAAGWEFKAVNQFFEGGLPFQLAASPPGRGRKYAGQLRNVEVRDFHNWIRGDLADLAGTYILPRQPEPRPVDLDGCRADVGLMRHAFRDFILATLRDYEIRELPMTQSGIAWAIWRRRQSGRSADTLSFTARHDFLREQRRFTGGGYMRVIAQPQGREAWHFDIDSFYPHVAATVPLPVNGHDWECWIPTSDAVALRRFRNYPQWCFFAECTLTQPPDGPYLFSREAAEADGDTRRVYGPGTWKAYLCGEELREAVARGWVSDVERYWVMKSQGMPFASYMQEMHQQKLRSVGPKRELAKLLLNSLIGRSAGSAGHWTPLPDYLRHLVAEVAEYEDPDDSESGFWAAAQGNLFGEYEREYVPLRRSFGRLEYLGARRAEAAYSQPAYWAALTAHCRMVMGRIVAAIEDSGGIVFSVNTDGLYVDSAGREWIEANLDVGEGLGRWQLDDLEPCTDGYFESPGVYLWRGQEVRAGVDLAQTFTGVDGQRYERRLLEGYSTRYFDGSDTSAVATFVRPAPYLETTARRS